MSTILKVVSSRRVTFQPGTLYLAMPGWLAVTMGLPSSGSAEKSLSVILSPRCSDHFLVQSLKGITCTLTSCAYVPCGRVTRMRAV